MTALCFGVNHILIIKMSCFFFLSLIRHYFGIWQGQADKVSLQRKLQEMNFQCLIKVTHN